MREVGSGADKSDEYQQNATRRPLRPSPPLVSWQGREVVAEELIAVLEKIPKIHAQMTVSLLNEKWDYQGESGAGEPDPRET